MITTELAQQWYKGADPVHNFDHILRVYRMAERLAIAEGADLDIVRPAALLHDAGGSDPRDPDARKLHHLHSAEFAARILGEHSYTSDQIERIQHCIRAHRFRGGVEKPETIEAKVIYDADKLDSIGAIGVARALAYSALADSPFYYPPSDNFLNGFQVDSGEPHSSYHEHLFKLSKIKNRMFTESGKRLAARRHEYMEAYFSKLISEWNSDS